MPLSITTQPKFIESSKSTVTVVLTNTLQTGETMPGKAYVTIHTIPSKNIVANASKGVNTPTEPLERPFISSAADSSATATFNIGNALHTLFTTYTVPDTVTRIQKDESSYFGYFLKYGTISYNDQNEQVFNYVGQTSVYWVLRSSFNDNNITTYVPDYLSGQAGKWLTNVPDNHQVHINEDLYLTALLPKNVADTDNEKAVFVKGDFYFSDGTSLKNLTIQSFTHRSGGNYIFNFRPSYNLTGTGKSINQLTKMVCWLDYLNGSDSGNPVASVPNYTATRSYTASCSSGYTGNPVTVSKTVTSEVSQAAAEADAYAQAQAEAVAALQCTLIPFFTASATYTATCPAGTTGNPVTVTTTRTSTISQADAQAKADADVRVDAEGDLVCTPVPVYTASATYTASCPSDSTGNDVTVTVTRTSTISQQDAQDRANADAQANAEGDLVCTPVQEYWYCHYYDNDGCFSGQMISNLGNYRACTGEEGAGCWTEYGGYGYCGANPY